MKKNVILVLLTFVALNLFAKSPTGDKVDPSIEARFKKQYGSLVNVSWKVIDDISIATYSEQGEERNVYYYDNGEVFGLGKIIKREELPESINEAIKKRFSDGVVQTVYEFKAPATSTRYYVRIVTPRHSMIVSGDEFSGLQVDTKQRLSSF